MFQNKLKNSIGQKIKYKYICNYHYKIINLYGDKQPRIDKQEIAYQSNGPLLNSWEVKWIDWQDNEGIYKVTRFVRDELKLPEKLINGFWEITSVRYFEDVTWQGNPETDSNVIEIRYDVWHYEAVLDNVIWKFQIIPNSNIDFDFVEETSENFYFKGENDE